MKKYLALTMFLGLFVFVGQVKAQPKSIEVGMDTRRVAGSIEKVKERVTLFSKFSKEKKVEYRMYLMDKRLAEFAYVLENGSYDRFEETSTRYSAYAGRLGEYVNDKNVDNKRDEVIEKYKSDKERLTSWQQNFEYDSAWWLLIQHDINSLDGLINMLGN